MKNSILKLSVAVFIAAFIFWGCGNETKNDSAVPASDSLSTSYLNTAVKTATWLQANAMVTPHGITWRANPTDSASVFNTLYYGSPGILLYFLELYHATGDTSYLHVAERASADLLAIVTDPALRVRSGLTGPEDEKAGLYSGLSGIGFSLGEMYSATKGKKYLDGMVSCVKTIREWATVKGNTASWSSTEDVLGGDAGTGLFLLYAFELTKDSAMKNLAVQSGNFLMKKGIAVSSGLKWPMEPAFPRLMPNFSHGTAGVSYFLLQLYKVTGNKDFLSTATRGGNYLLASADPKTGLVFHHESMPDSGKGCKGPACVRADSCIGTRVFYLGWCHGPAGSGRFYYSMGQATKDTLWNGLIEKSAHGILNSGIPETLTDGFWNNLDQCCGSSGVGDYFLTLERMTGKPEYAAYAKHLAEFVRSKAVEEAGGLKFPNAENNRERDVVYAQTGYMTGAAGIGMFYLHLYEKEKGIDQLVKFPDNPF